MNIKKGLKFGKPVYFALGFLLNLPVALYVLSKCIFYRIPPNWLAKADYGMYQGDIGFASKYAVQKMFDAACFPKTILIKKNLGDMQKKKQIIEFAKHEGYPVILKPDVGYCGKGAIKIKFRGDLEKYISALKSDYICQKFLDYPLEFGIFYCRIKNKPKILSLNERERLSVVGDGKRTVLELLKSRDDFDYEWISFIRGLDLDEIPADNKKIKVSFISNYFMGGEYFDRSEFITKKVTEKVKGFVKDAPGFNYGRIDAIAKSYQDFKKGKFMILEVNGISSVPGIIYDSKYSLAGIYGIMAKHLDSLLEAAKENKMKKMENIGIIKIIADSFSAAEDLKKNAEIIAKIDEKLMGRLKQ